MIFFLWFCVLVNSGSCFVKGTWAVCVLVDVRWSVLIVSRFVCGEMSCSLRVYWIISLSLKAVSSSRFRSNIQRALVCVLCEQGVCSLHPLFLPLYLLKNSAFSCDVKTILCESECFVPSALTERDAFFSHTSCLLFISVMCMWYMVISASSSVCVLYSDVFFKRERGCVWHGCQSEDNFGTGPGQLTIKKILIIKY